jgi:hypothetical protein
LTQIFDEVDLDSSGSVSFEEFFKVFNKMDANKISLSSVLKRWQTFADAGDIGNEFSAAVPQKKSKIPLW